MGEKELTVVYVVTKLVILNTRQCHSGIFQDSCVVNVIQKRYQNTI